MSETDKEFFKFVNEFNGEIFDIVKIIQTAKERGIHVDYSMLRLLAPSMGYKETVVLPASIPNFISSLLKDFYPKTILDPWSNTGSLLSPIVEFAKPQKALGITPIGTFSEISRLLTKGENITWTSSDLFYELKDTKENFDLIVSALPIGSKINETSFNEPDLHGDYGMSLLVRSCQLLSDQGMGIFLVPQSFFHEIFQNRKNKIRAVLSRNSLHLDAAFLINEGVFEPVTSISTYLIVIQRHKPKELFVGQIFGNEQRDNILLQNYRERRAAKIPHQGALVDEANFKGLDGLVAKYEADQIIARSGLTTHSLRDITTSINFAKKFPGSEFTETANAIYLSIIDKSDVVTSAEDLTLNPQQYIQIIFDEKKALAPYLARFLNSRLGIKIRENWSFETTTAGIINNSHIETNLIYLPDLHAQEEAVRVNSDITNLSAELTSLQNELWEFPAQSTKIEGKLKKVSQQKGWELWLEELPFPMASILWAYLATVDPKDKLDHISHFFEASIQFLVMISLSALAQDREYYRLNQKSWNSENPKYKGWYKTASFGSWLSLHSSLAKFIRGLLSKEDTKSRCLSLFGNADEQFVQAITNKKLLSVFQDANSYRNLWIGHRGRLSDEEAQKRVAIFENLLSNMREVIGDSFSQILLLSPQTSEYVDGVFEYKVKAIKGTRPEFREQIVQSLVPLDKKKLYILPEFQVTPIEVLPFGKLMSSPVTAQNAFYFYSRFDTEGVRWVSYHFEKEAEVIFPDMEMVGIMKELFDGDTG